MLAVVAVLLSGVVVGTYGWRSVQQGNDQVRLAAGPIEVAFSREEGRPPAVTGPHQLRVMLVNDSGQDTDVVDARLTGWSSFPGYAFSAQQVPAGGSANLRMVVEPDCEGGPAGQLEVDVRTGTGVSTVALALPPEPHIDIVGHLYRRACEGAAPMLSAHNVSVSQEPGAMRVLTMSVRLSSSAPDTRITAVTSAVPGFSVEGPTLPTPITSLPNAGVDLAWSVVDCAATNELDEAAIDAEVSTGETTATLPISLGRTALVELASFAGEVCPS